jgi:exosortase
MSNARITDHKLQSPAGTRRGAFVRRQDQRARQMRLQGYIALVALLALAFMKPLTALAIYAAQTDLHSHILLIPFVSLYLILIQRNRLPQDYATSSGSALLAFLIGLTGLIVAWGSLKADPPLSQNDYLSITAFSFVCFLAAGGFLFLGREWMAAVAFPMAFLIFIAPLPDRVLQLLETASQLASTEVAAIFFTLTGTPMMQNGTVFQLPGIAIEVAQECSGIRSSWVLFITTLAASYLFLKSPWRRAVLIAFVIRWPSCVMVFAFG